jgi:hypothetical protein
MSPEAASLVVWAEVSNDSCTIALALLKFTVSVELGVGGGFGCTGLGRAAADGAAAAVWAALVTGLIILKILLHVLSAARGQTLD